MIVAQKKDLGAIRRMVEGSERLLIVGCGECVTVAQAGGQREVDTLANILRVENPHREIRTRVLRRQCEPEFVEELAAEVDWPDRILSLGCGVGVGFLADRYPAQPVLPGLDTTFGGGSVAPGLFEERCGFCGECVLDRTGGICPVVRCAKGLLNGPCGGSVEGRCEVASDLPCAWTTIYNRLAEQGRLDLLEENRPPRDWSRAQSGGLRRVQVRGWGDGRQSTAGDSRTG